MTHAIPQADGDLRSEIEWICAYNRLFRDAGAEVRGPNGGGWLSIDERELAERSFAAGESPEHFVKMILQRRAAPAVVRLAGNQNMSFGAVVKALREKSACKTCGKSTVVFNVAGHRQRFRGEQVTVATHCACEGGPAHHLLSQAVAS